MFSRFRYNTNIIECLLFVEIYIKDYTGFYFMDLKNQ